MLQTFYEPALAIVRDSLIRNYFTNGEYLASEEGQADLRAHLTLRFEHNRERVVPWLESFLPLRESPILEIGCGTAASLAFEYSRFSSRNYFREMYRVRSPENELHFLRRGRGVSFLEFELFMAPRQNLDIVSCLHTYLRELDPQEKQQWIDSGSSAYEEMLHRARPGLHPAFLTQNLDLAIQKH
jgi:hypothetical protein